MASLRRESHRDPLPSVRTDTGPDTVGHTHRGTHRNNRPHLSGNVWDDDDQDLPTGGCLQRCSNCRDLPGYAAAPVTRVPAPETGKMHLAGPAPECSAVASRTAHATGGNGGPHGGNWIPDSVADQLGLNSDTNTDGSATGDDNTILGFPTRTVILLAGRRSRLVLLTAFGPPRCSFAVVSAASPQRRGGSIRNKTSE